MRAKVCFVLEITATICAIGLGINKLITLISDFREKQI